MSLTFYFRYAVRSLQRDGQRTLLGILCIAFGVLSLVSMQLLAGMISDVLAGDPRLELNGDAILNRRDRFIADAELAQLEQWKREGLLADYAPRAARWGTLLKSQRSGRVVILNDGFGIEPEQYPLVGALTMREPAGANPAALLQAERDAILTRDVADDLNLKVGESFSLEGNGAPVQLRVAGIARSTPYGMGSAVFYNMETARLLSQRPDPITEVSILWGGNGPDLALLEANDWSFITTDTVLDSRAYVSNLFNLMLNGAGILGLIVGGVGVANTMQVLLARRTLEIATLKTHGYRQHHPEGRANQPEQEAAPDDGTDASE